MRYLLDVNVLVAHGLRHHTFHQRVESWLQSLQDASLLTCSITELGFVRILSMPAVGGFRVEQAKELLLAIKQAVRPVFIFQPDANDISLLPAWAQSPKQVTDGHLLALAEANDAVLATLDARIPGAFLVPEA